MLTNLQAKLFPEIVAPKAQLKAPDEKPQSTKPTMSADEWKPSAGSREARIKELSLRLETADPESAAKIRSEIRVLEIDAPKRRAEAGALLQQQATADAETSEDLSKQIEALWREEHGGGEVKRTTTPDIPVGGPVLVDPAGLRKGKELLTRGLKELSQHRPAPEEPIAIDPEVIGKLGNTIRDGFNKVRSGVQGMRDDLQRKQQAAELQSSLKYSQEFDKLDKNDDGRVSKNENIGNGILSPLDAARHSGHDLNNDGEITRQEYQTARRREQLVREGSIL